ncbi:MAG: hypothetical protein ACKVH7_02325 [Alphaproteobacteria bacterium]|jgi:hypothetical protein
MMKLILLAALLIPIATGAQAYNTKPQELVIHNRSTTTDLVGFSLHRDGMLSENWLEGPTWESYATLSGMETVTSDSTVCIDWQHENTREGLTTYEALSPCDVNDLYLTQDGRVLE